MFFVCFLFWKENSRPEKNPKKTPKKSKKTRKNTNIILFIHTTKTQKKVLFLCFYFQKKSQSKQKNEKNVDHPSIWLAYNALVSYDTHWYHIMIHIRLLEVPRRKRYAKNNINCKVIVHWQICRTILVEKQ